MNCHLYISRFLAGFACKPPSAYDISMKSIVNVVTICLWCARTKKRKLHIKIVQQMELCILRVILCACQPRYIRQKIYLHIKQLNLRKNPRTIFRKLSTNLFTHACLLDKINSNQNQIHFQSL